MRPSLPPALAAAAAAVALLLAALAGAGPAPAPAPSLVREPPAPPLPTSSVQTHYNDTVVPRRCSCVCGVAGRRERIVGGHVARVNEFPWLVLLSRAGRFYCGGSLISSRHVLTAAHCFEGINYRDVTVTLGEHDRSVTNESDSMERRVANASKHSEFTLATFNHDIALLTLDQPVEFGPTVRPACLPLRAGTNYTNNVGVVAGWGRIAERKPTSDALRKVSVPIMSMERCRRSGYARNRITDNMICAGYPQGKQDACQGDSGGPMHISDGPGSSMEVIGLVSWGRGCARPNYPGIYTRVANYLGWLEQRLGDDCLCSPPSHA